nr:nidogen-like domain-containing protein [Glacieibacterium frigidum]
MLKVGLVAALGAALLSSAAFAAPLADGFGGPEGYGALSQSPNDDGSSNELNLPFTLNFFGQNYSTFYVNNNGNISFGNPLGTFTPSPFPASIQPIIAPYWADVDTRNQPGGGAVYVASPNATTTVVTWHDVGFYNANNSRTNDFQLILSDRSNVAGAGDFDIEFRYNRLEWTTGSASGGDANGLGGVPAQAGYDAGDGVNFFTLPGSRTNDVLELQNTSNVSLETPGLWRFAIRNGEITTGDSADRPLLPTVVTEDGYEFDFGVQLGQRVFIDPFVAVGYDYVVNTGPNIASVLLPDLGDADGYEIYGFNSMTGMYDTLLTTLAAGVEYVFGPGGVSSFAVRDIEVTPFLDPDNPLAFVTGLTFAGAGQVNMTQSPFTVFVAGGVPEPATWAMLIGGFGMVGAMARRRRSVVAS